MGVLGLGQPVPRTEDPRLLRGNGRYIDDMDAPGMVHGHILRSPHAHAKILSMNIEAAARAPGVLAVLTGEDLSRTGLTAPCPQAPRKRSDGGPAFIASQPLLAGKEVFYTGEPVAFIIAESLYQALDGAELLEVDYDPLPVGVSSLDNHLGRAPSLRTDCPANEAFYHQVGDAKAVAEAFNGAAHRVHQQLVINRVTAAAMETRGCIGCWDGKEERYILDAATQGPHAVRRHLAIEVFGIPEDAIQVRVPDVGGGFGMKGGYQVEHALVLWASREVGRPVKWVSSRAEGMLSDFHARDMISDAELALDEDGRFLAMRSRGSTNIGAYWTTDRNAAGGVVFLGVMAGSYATPAMHAGVNVRYSNRNIVAPYRGAGRPDSAYLMERMIDVAAFQTGMDAAHLRRINTIPAQSMPYVTPLGDTYDCGDFGANLEEALSRADYEGFPGRRTESAGRGKLRGIGISNSVEPAGGQPLESAELRFDGEGNLKVLIGTQDSGQGHATMFTQMVSDALGLDWDRVRIIEGDTDRIRMGSGSFGARSDPIGGSALMKAADKIIVKGRLIAAHLLEAAESDLDFADGQFSVGGTDKHISLVEVAKSSFQLAKMPLDLEPGLYEFASFRAEKATYPNGCHVCELEVDPETGATRLLAYTMVDDVGRVINPLLLAGQLVGGAVQGAGQALMENIHYDDENGQLLSGGFMDYAMPRATDVCPFSIHENEILTDANPMGVKGAAEAGTVGALSAVMNALNNALAPLGIRHLDMPATPERVWRAIRNAGNGAKN